MKTPPSLPPVLDPGNAFVDPKLQSDVKKATGGDPEKLRLGNAIIYMQTPKDIEECLKLTSWNIRRAKIYSGTVPYRNDLQDIVSICRDYGVDPYLGGGVFETSRDHRKHAKTMKAISKIGISTVEVSNGDDTMSEEQYSRLIRSARQEFQTLLVEVGSKESNCESYDRWRSDIQAANEGKADEIIIEGTGSGVGGIYDEEGSSKTLLVACLLSDLKNPPVQPVIEAPDYRQQKYWLGFGGMAWDTRMGNIHMNANVQFELAQHRLKCADKDVREMTSGGYGRLVKLAEALREACQSNKMRIEELLDDPRLFNLRLMDESDVERSIIAVNRIAEKNKEGSHGRSFRLIQIGGNGQD